MNAWNVVGISRFNTKKGAAAAVLHLAREGKNMEGNEVLAQFVMADMIPAGLHIGDDVRIIYNRNSFVEAIEIVG